MKIPVYLLVIFLLFAGLLAGFFLMFCADRTNTGSQQYHQFTGFSRENTIAEFGNTNKTGGNTSGIPFDYSRFLNETDSDIELLFPEWPDETLQPQGQKINDSEVCIDEWNRSAPAAHYYSRNITIIPVTDEDFRSFPELQRVMREVKDKPPANSSEWAKSVSYFNANQSDYYGWLLDSICRNKTRIDCYADGPAFEYHGRYYFIDIASF
jgi:hypothetical protein